MARLVHTRLDPAMILRARFADNTMIVGNMMKLVVMEWVTDHLVTRDELAELNWDNLLECSRNTAIFRIPKMDKRVRTRRHLEPFDWAIKGIQNGCMLISHSKGSFRPNRGNRGYEACCQRDARHRHRTNENVARCNELVYTCEGPKLE